jgi:hypothetical protein
MSSRIFQVLCLGTLFLSGCSTVSSPLSQRLDPNDPQFLARKAKIAAEPPGNYYIGRRFWLEGTNFWGFVRKPGQQWSEAKLVMMGEQFKKAPDRLPEDGPVGQRHGFDHNYEYKLYGEFSGQRIYDPNSNQILPEFVLRNYELISTHPGFLFHPKEKFEPRHVPAPPKF